MIEEDYITTVGKIIPPKGKNRMPIRYLVSYPKEFNERLYEESMEAIYKIIFYYDKTKTTTNESCDSAPRKKKILNNNGGMLSRKSRPKRTRGII